MINGDLFNQANMKTHQKNPPLRIVSKLQSAFSKNGCAFTAAAPSRPSRTLESVRNLRIKSLAFSDITT
jgi:hypothetical protein